MNFKLINDIEIEAAQFMDATESIMKIVDMFPKTDIIVSYFDRHKPKLKQDGLFELNVSDWIVKYKSPWSKKYNVKVFADDEFKNILRRLKKC